MNSMDLPAAPPSHGFPLTLSECASALVPSFTEPGQADEVMARRIDAALTRLLKHGVLREWGMNAMGRPLYSTDSAFAFDPTPRKAAGVLYLYINLPEPPE